MHVSSARLFICHKPLSSVLRYVGTTKIVIQANNGIPSFHHRSQRIKRHFFHTRSRQSHSYKSSFDVRPQSRRLATDFPTLLSLFALPESNPWRIHDVLQLHTYALVFFIRTNAINPAY